MDGLDVKMTPMIDVVFLLLVFFVWTASFGIVERLLPSSLASLSGGPGSRETDPEMLDFDVVVVRLELRDEQPIWTVNDHEQESLQAVEETLSSVAAIKSDLPVVVDPQPTVPLGHVIDVYDISRRVGFDTVQFTAVGES
jgi:biopolymer transport protein ExbD